MSISEQCLDSCSAHLRRGTSPCVTEMWECHPTVSQGPGSGISRCKSVAS